MFRSLQPNLQIRRFWLGITVAIAAAYAIAAILPGFQGPDHGALIVPEDGRQHLFWMAQWDNPELFAGDLLADYFKSVAPWGFRGVFVGGHVLGIDPLVLAKVLPLPLTMITAVYGFRVMGAIVPVPWVGALGTVLLLQNLWLRDDLASGSARAFLNPILLAVLDALLRRSPGALALTIILLGGFYPSYVLVVAVLVILRWLGSVWARRRAAIAPPVAPPSLPENATIAADTSAGAPTPARTFWSKFHWRSDLGLMLVGLGAAVITLLPFALATSAYDPTISRPLATTLPEFLPNGRSRFFYADFGRFWLSGGRSGIQVPLEPPWLAAGFLLPLLYWWRDRQRRDRQRRDPRQRDPRQRDRFPFLNQVNGAALTLLPQVAIAGFTLFFAAHALLFRLHLPSRYTQHTLRITLAFSAAIALATLCQALVNRRRSWRSGAIAISLVALLAYPLTWSRFPRVNYTVGAAPDLYTWLRSQPTTTLVASLSAEADNLPTFAHRPILIGQEYAIPYQWGYYRLFRTRVLAAIAAQYSTEPGLLRTVIQRYGIGLWLLDPGAFTADYLRQNAWLRQYDPAYSAALATLDQGQVPALAHVQERCQVWQSERAIVLDTACILENLP
jgi:hypothetical protein